MSTTTRINVAAVMARHEQMLEQQRQNLGQLCARGVPGAWDVLVAIHGEPVRGKAVR